MEDGPVRVTGAVHLGALGWGKEGPADGCWRPGYQDQVLITEAWTYNHGAYSSVPGTRQRIPRRL